MGLILSTDFNPQVMGRILENLTVGLEAGLEAVPVPGLGLGPGGDHVPVPALGLVPVATLTLHHSVTVMNIPTSTHINILFSSEQNTDLSPSPSHPYVSPPPHAGQGQSPEVTVPSRVIIVLVRTPRGALPMNMSPSKEPLPPPEVKLS